jgi:hypothetical protein
VEAGLILDSGFRMEHVCRPLPTLYFLLSLKSLANYAAVLARHGQKEGTPETHCGPTQSGRNAQQENRTELRRPTPDSGYIRKWDREIGVARKNVKKLTEQLEK